MPQATYVQEGSYLDYTASGTLSAGDVVVQGDLVGVVSRALVSGELGSLAVCGVFDFTKNTGVHTKFIRTELFAMPGTVQNVTLYRGSETRTIQVDPDLSQATEVDFRQYAGGGFQVPASSSLNGYTLNIYAAVAPGANYSLLVVNGTPVTMTIYQDQFNELPEQVYGTGALKFTAGIAGPLELVLKT